MPKVPARVLITAAFLGLNLLSLGNYGYTWDYPHHYNAGIKRLEHITGRDLSFLPRQDKSTFGDQPYGPIADSLPVLSQIIFHYKLGLLPADSAYHLPLILAAALGIYFLFDFARSAFGTPIAILSTVILSLYPRFIGHIHNNPKDTFSAVFFALAIIAIYNWIKQLTNASIPPKSVTERLLNFTPLTLAAFLTAVAFNMKVNAVLILPVITLWLVISFPDKIFFNAHHFLKTAASCLAFLILSASLSLLLWSFFWPQPLLHIQDLIRHFSSGTTGFPIFYYGKIYAANINVPWHYALGYLAAVTPLPVLVFFLIGFVICFKNSIRLKDRASGLLLVWFLVPTLKYLNPKIGILDDIRHFLEVVFPLAVISAIGAKATIDAISASPRMTFLRQFTKSSVAERLAIAGITIYLAFQAYSLHPYQTAYYSEWLGGLRGVAQKNLFDVEFWGNALKEGSSYLNQTAPLNSIVYVPMAQQVAREYLRPDITVTQVPHPRADFLLVFNRYSMLSSRFGVGSDIYQTLENHPPVFTISRQDTPILWTSQLQL